MNRPAPIQNPLGEDSKKNPSLQAGAFLVDSHTETSLSPFQKLDRDQCTNCAQFSNTASFSAIKNSAWSLFLGVVLEAAREEGSNVFN